MTSKEPYDSIAAKAGAIPTDQARVWVYAIGGYGTGEAIIFGPHTEFITFNRAVYRFGGNAYFYIDVPAGHYKITTTGVLKFSAGIHPRFRSGKIQKPYTFDGGKEYFLRTEFSRKGIPFESVDQERAASEMKGLKFFEKHVLEDQKYKFDE